MCINNAQRLLFTQRHVVADQQAAKLHSKTCCGLLHWHYTAATLLPAGKPVMPLPPAPQLPASVKVEIGDKGESCTATCDKTHSTCAAQHMVAMNHCNVLRTHFACEAGCDNSGGDVQPSYVSADAPKEQQPTDCLTAESESQFSCDASHPNTQRLCPCAQTSHIVTTVA